MNEITLPPKPIEMISKATDYAKRPKWKECENWGARFSDCKCFCDKAKCWERFDRERK